LMAKSLLRAVFFDTDTCGELSKDCSIQFYITPTTQPHDTDSTMLALKPISNQKLNNSMRIQCYIQQTQPCSHTPFSTMIELRFYTPLNTK